MMEKRYYRFAGVDIQVEIPPEAFYDNERHLADFAVDSVEDPHRFCYEIVETLPAPEEPLIADMPGFSVHKIPGGHVRYIGGSNAYVRAEHMGKIHRILVRKNEYTDRVGVKTALESMEVEHLIAQNHGVVFHCAYIEHNGKAILFTAPSGTGKSTQADLWAKYRGTEIINGDRAAVRLADGVLMAEGIPFAGSSQYCKNRSLPIEAIVYLGQAPKTTIRKLRGYEAFAKIWEGVSVNTWDKEDMELVSEVVQQAAANVPVFHLPCTPDESAVIALEQELGKLVSL